MNYCWDTHAHQQSNKISPLSATVCVPYTQAELTGLFGVGRSTIYRTIDRMRPQLVEPQRPFGHLVPPSSNTGNLVQPGNSTVSRYGRYAESNQEARTFTRASSSLPPSRKVADSCHATFPWQGLNSAMDRKRNAQRQ